MKHIARPLPQSSLPCAHARALFLLKGIVAYLSEHAGFQGVIKQRFEDFHVHEIDQGGNVVRLTDLSVSADDEPQCEAPSPVTPEAVAQAQARLEELLTVEGVKHLHALSKALAVTK